MVFSRQYMGASRFFLGLCRQKFLAKTLVQRCGQLHYCIALFVLLLPLHALAEEENREEFVEIESIRYPVPEPWAGYRVEAKPLRPPALVKIPVQYTENGSSLYLLEEACSALVAMASDAEQEGVALRADSSYRSAWYQKKIFVRLMKEGRSFEDVARYVAPPGYSEHALGTVVDFSPSNWRFAKTPAYAWLKKHASRYGFYETLPQSPKRKTPWEAWHWRYLGNQEQKGQAAANN